MSLVANPIVETVKAPDGWWYYDYRLDNIVGNDGKVYTPFAWYEFPPGSSNGHYFVGVAYSGEQVNNLAEMGIKSFRGEEIKRHSATGAPAYDTVSTVELYSSVSWSDYNSDLKIGYCQILNFNDFNLMLPDDKGYIYKWWIPFLGDKNANPEEFWNKVKNLPKPKLAFEIDTSTTGGGDGEYDDNSSDTIGLPDLTNLNANSINNTRFFTCYKLTPEQLTALSKELWSKNFIDIISNSVLKPTDFIVSMNMIPIDVPSTPKRMKAGQWLLNGAIGGVVSGQFFRVDCGSIQIKKKWGGALDYLTKIALFLPFIGEVQLSPDDVMGSTISIIYTVDVMTGSCLASVKIVRDNLDAILYQYNGNCSSTYPIVSQDYSALMSGVLQLGIHTVADYSKSLPQLNKKGTNKGIIKNAKISRTEDVGSGATSCLFDISPNVQRVGNMSSTVGFMGIKRPFIILSRPIQSLAENYNTFRGFVSNISMTLGGCTGYTEVEEIHLENISATENEISEIENLLKSGVIF